MDSSGKTIQAPVTITIKMTKDSNSSLKTNYDYQPSARIAAYLQMLFSGGLSAVLGITFAVAMFNMLVSLFSFHIDRKSIPPEEVFDDVVDRCLNNAKTLLLWSVAVWCCFAVLAHMVYFQFVTASMLFDATEPRVASAWRLMAIEFWWEKNLILLAVDLFILVTLYKFVIYAVTACIIRVVSLCLVRNYKNQLTKKARHPVIFKQ